MKCRRPHPAVGLADRIVLARLVTARSMGEKVSQGRFGLLIGNQLGPGRTITGATVSRWESGEFEPDLNTLLAVAAVAEVDPGWLAFGPLSHAPATISKRDGKNV